ncbi:MAG: ABC transporter ATP-binding protein [Bacillota bacterium]|nr:ABC transporter ATP-binding protein [Bacillota bacterium]
MKKEQSIFKQLKPFMGRAARFFPFTFLLTGLAAVFQTLPYYFVWRILRAVLLPQGEVRMDAVMWDAGLAVGCAALGLICYFFGLMISHLAAFEAETQIKKQGVAALLKKPLGFYSVESSGRIRKTIYDGASKTHSFVAHQLPDIAGTAITPLILLILFFVIDWRLGLISFVPMIGGGILMATLSNEEGKERVKNYFAMHEALGAQSVEYVRGIPVVKTFGQTVRAFTRFYDSIIECRDVIMEYTMMWRHKMGIYYALAPAAAFFLVPVGILLLGAGEDPGRTLANILLFLFTAPILNLTMMRSAYFMQMKTDATVAMTNITDLLSYSELDFPEDSAMPANARLEFEDVTFRYGEADDLVLKGITFDVGVGESLAIVGPSGSGKTTIARLAARFWDPTSGRIRLGGTDLRRYSQKALMSNISFVFQNSDLFKMSIRENLLLAKPDATEEQIRSALEGAQAAEIIARLPQGLETVIGSKGVYLSGGEKQRIALARAFLKDAPLLLLDEATAFADPENEHLLQKALATLRERKTTLFIAHRLSTVKDMNRILVLDRGEIVEIGSHDELMRRGGLYRAMYEEYERSIEWKIGTEGGVAC